MKTIPITVLIATRNGACRIESTVASLSQQKVDPKYNVEIIIASSSIEDQFNKERIIIDSYCKKPFKIKHVYVAHLNKSKNLNLGITKVNQHTRFIFFIDDDCVLEDNHLQKKIDLFNLHPDVGGIIGPYTYASNSYFTNSYQAILNSNEARSLEQVYFGIGGNMSVRWENVTKSIKFNQHMHTSDDTEYVCHLASQGVKTIIWKSITVTHINYSHWWTILNKNFLYGWWEEWILHNCSYVQKLHLSTRLRHSYFRELIRFVNYLPLFYFPGAAFVELCKHIGQISYRFSNIRNQLFHYKQFT